MAELRTKIQREANTLDMEMHRLAGQIEQFATLISRSEQADDFRQLSTDILHARVDVRRFMHRKDFEATK